VGSCRARLRRARRLTATLPDVEVILLGTGGPRPDPDRHGPATLVRIDDRYLLFDAGRGVVMQLARAGVPLDRIGPVFVTHHHFDHIVDLADVALATWLERRPGALDVVGPAGTARIVSVLLEQIYDKDIHFRAQGEPAIGGFKPVHATDAVPGVVAEGPGFTVRAEPVVHGHGLDFSAEFRRRWVCFGYRVEVGDAVVTISGDTIACEGLDRLAQGADVLVQCCYLARSEIGTEHMRQVARSTLACADTVGGIARRARVKRLVLTHFRRKTDDVLATIADDVRRDFAGEVVLGRDLLRLAVH
jgi:ribonuclease Z